MKIWEIVLIGLSVAADAFAVAVCKGVEMKKFSWKYGLSIALCFGGFQMLMPVIGWAVAAQFERYVTEWDHWVAFVLLALLGGKMVAESFRKKETPSDAPPKLGLKTLLVMSVATSIDALAVGVTFAFLNVNVGEAVGIIGAITFALTLLGVFIGTKAGGRFGAKAEFAGGLLLVLLGVKILLEHLGIISF